MRAIACAIIFSSFLMASLLEWRITGVAMDKTEKKIISTTLIITGILIILGL